MYLYIYIYYYYYYCYCYCYYYYRQTGGRTSHPKEKGETNPANPATQHASTHYFVHLSHERQTAGVKDLPGSCWEG